jgi:hypothetical protein
MVELYIHFLTRLHVMVLNELSTGKTLRFTFQMRFSNVVISKFRSMLTL